MTYHETSADRAREISDANLIDASFTTPSDNPDWVDTPAVMARFHADEQFHRDLRQQAA